MLESLRRHTGLALELFERVRTDPRCSPDHLDQIRGWVESSEASARFLEAAEADFSSDPTQSLRTRLSQLRLLKTWLPSGPKQVAAAELFNRINARELELRGPPKK